MSLSNTKTLIKRWTLVKESSSLSSLPSFRQVQVGEAIYYYINNGNWTAWSAPWSEIILVISKLNEHAAWLRFRVAHIKQTRLTCCLLVREGVIFGLLNISSVRSMDMLQVKTKFRLNFFNLGWVSIAFVSKRLNSWIILLGLGDKGNWESTQVKKI